METLSIANPTRSSDGKGRKEIFLFTGERTEIEIVPKVVGERCLLKKQEKVAGQCP